MNTKWIDPEPIDIPGDFIKAVGGHPLVAKTLYKRGMTNFHSAQAFMHPEFYKPSPPAELLGLMDAADILEDAINSRMKIGVWGDFDVDGQTATALLVSILSGLGADVIYYIPNRIEESHGVNLRKLKDFISKGIDILLTCDTGISDFESIKYAIQSGIKVIITDHHDLPGNLPRAHAVVNPKLLDETHPLRTLPGVGVAFKVAEELLLRGGQTEEISHCYDLVALGIVADLAPQKGDTRYLLQSGLKHLQINPRIGVRALFETAGVLPENVTEEHIGYILSPRLNALGRISDAGIGVKLLLTNDPEYAKQCSIEIEKINEDRRLITQQVFQAAISKINADQSILSEPVLVLDHPAWPVGVIGIVANRLVEYYNRPTILISSPPNGLARGSARSIEGINISEAISDQKNLLERCGGHPMAAGFTLKRELIPEFKQALFNKLEAEFNGKSLENPLMIDQYFNLIDITPELVADLERLAPFGPGNPPLILACRELKILNYSKVGQNGEHLSTTIKDKYGTTKQAIWWQGSGWSIPEREFDLVFKVRTSTYRGKKDIQIEWIGYKYSTENILSVKDNSKSISIIDHRNKQNPMRLLEELLTEENIEIWIEGRHLHDLEGSNRYKLKQAEQFVIWTVPPGRKELMEAVKIVNPSIIYIFGIDPGMDNPEQLLIRLAGLLKYVLRRKQGVTDIHSLAAACAQRVPTIRESLKWLQIKGYFDVDLSDEERIFISESSAKERYSEEEVTIRLNSLLQESAAYRSFFSRADKETLFIS